MIQDDGDGYQPGVKGFAKDVGKELGRGALSLLKWTGWGAAIGSVSGAGFGLYHQFDTEGLAFLTLGGLVVGAIAGFLLRFFLEAGPLD